MDAFCQTLQRYPFKNVLTFFSCSVSGTISAWGGCLWDMTGSRGAAAWFSASLTFCSLLVLQQKAYDDRTESLKAKSETGGLVSRNQAKNELAQHLAGIVPFDDPIAMGFPQSIASHQKESLWCCVSAVVYIVLSFSSEHEIISITSLR